MNLSEKITNFFMKTIIFPIILFVLYGLAWMIGLTIAQYICNDDNMLFVVLMMIITSILCLILTMITQLITTKIKPNIIFKNWFEWWHLVLMYASALITVIIALKPIIEESGIIYPNIGSEQYAVVVSIFFLLTFNYYFYKALVINKDIVLLPYVKEIIKKYFSIEILADTKERIVRNYFKSWIGNDIFIIEKQFSDCIVYYDSSGQAYIGLEQIKAWFIDWHKYNKVMEWDIKELEVLDRKVICNWYFKYFDGNTINEFNGISEILFNDKNKIIKVKEYMSKLPVYYPYNRDIGHCTAK